VSDWPWHTWNVDRLTLAAYFYSPDLDLARANLANAQAAAVTAGARPNPSVGLGAGYESTPDSPYLWNIDFALPIETAGKRGYRVLEASQLTEAARVSLAETAWQVRMKVRSALLAYLNAEKQVDALKREEQARVAKFHLLETRLNAGEIARPEVTAGQLEVFNLRLALRAQEGAEQSGLGALAAAIGVPVGALETQQLVWTEYESLPRISPGMVRRDAALNRLDLRESLAAYQASEVALRLEIAKQYPDLRIGPSGGSQEGYNQLSLGVSLELPVLNQNQGPIGEAEARRKQAAAKVRSLQSTAIAEADEALTRYNTALRQLEEAEAGFVTLQTQSEPQARRAVQAGEQERSTVEEVAAEKAVAARARLDALYAAQTALGAVENAVQKPLAGTTTHPDLSQKPLRGHESANRPGRAQ
jgi:outer membrane protein TolC